MIYRTLFTAVMFTIALSGCEELGIPDPAKDAARAQAEGEAIGSACRHAGRALEDCYARNPTAEKAAIFAGWLSMNDYMTENNLDVIKSPTEAQQMTQGADPGENHADDAPRESSSEQAPEPRPPRRS